MVERVVVELDDGDWVRRHRERLPRKIRREIRASATGTLQRITAVDRKRCVGDLIDAGVIDRTAVGRQEAIGHLIIGCDWTERGESIAADQHALVRRRCARQVGRKRE